MRDQQIFWRGGERWIQNKDECSRLLDIAPNLEAAYRLDHEAQPDTIDVDFIPSPEFWYNIAERVVRNVRPDKGKRCPRWAAVSEATAHGSTYSKDLCRFFHLDPDEILKR